MMWWKMRVSTGAHMPWRSMWSMTIAPPGIVPLMLMYLLETMEGAPSRWRRSGSERYSNHFSTSWSGTVCWEEKRLGCDCFVKQSYKINTGRYLSEKRWNPTCESKMIGLPTIAKLAQVLWILHQRIKETAACNLKQESILWDAETARKTLILQKTAITCNVHWTMPYVMLCVAAVKS